MKLFDFWPNFLKDIEDFHEISEALQPEIDDFKMAVHDMHKEFSLFTMSEYGCTRWERIMRIIPAATDSVETRRQRILVRYLSQLPYTYRRLLQYLAQTTQGYTVDLDAANYEIYIAIQTAGYSQRTALLATLVKMLPANLVLHLQTLVQQEVERARLAVAAIMLTQTRHIHEPIQR